MNVDAQFPQAPIAAQPTRSLQAQAEQTTVRPVDKSDKDASANNQTGTDARQTEAQKAADRPAGEARDGRPETELDGDEKKQLQQLQARDREVRAHEAAHKAAAGNLARSGTNFDFEKGPDGQRYAVGGEVNIDTAKVSGDPQATISKAQTIRAAANAPAQPSGQDRAVAAQATRMEAEARLELAEEKRPDAGSARNESAGRNPASTFQANSNNGEPVGELLDVLA